MKRLAVIFIIVAVYSQAFAQKTIKIEDLNQDEVKTVFKKDKRDGFYGSFSLAYSPIDNQHGIVASSRGSWIMDHWFAFGLGGSAFVNNLTALDPMSNIGNTYNTNLGGAYGGMYVEFIVFPKLPVHLSFPIMAGVGAASTFNTRYSTYVVPEDYFYVLEPGVELEFNFTNWIRLAAFATYRYTPDIRINGVAPDALRSYSAGVTVKMGVF